MDNRHDIKFFLEGVTLRNDSSWALPLPEGHVLSIGAVETHPGIGDKIKSHPGYKAYREIAGLDQSILPIAARLNGDEKYFGGFIDLMAGIACLRREAHSSPLAAGILGLTLASIRLKALQGGPDVEYFHAEKDEIFPLLRKPVKF